MKTSLFAIVYVISFVCCLGQPQAVWVARYNGSFTDKMHTPMAMKLDTAGNIYVAGTSQNASNYSDYVVLKYAPDGTQLFAARYGPTNGTTYPANGFALDRNGNTYITGGVKPGASVKSYLVGNGATVKFNTNGAVAWAASFPGNDVAVDTNGNVYVTGFSSTTYATVKLDSNGSNLWTRTYVGVAGPDNPVSISQKVAVDDAANVFVAGWTDYPPGWNYPGQTNLNYYSHAEMLTYDATGNCLWTNAYLGSGGVYWGQTQGLIPDNRGNIYVLGNPTSGAKYQTAKLSSSGQTVWSAEPYNSTLGAPGGQANGLCLDISGNVYLTGVGYWTAKLASTDGRTVWQTFNFQPNSEQGNCIIVDAKGSIYVVGVLSSVGNGNDFALMRYDNVNGNQQLVTRYNGPANGDDGATAIAVAPDGSIYVTGYSANASGGVDITTIKYVYASTIQKKPDGSVQLEFYGTPGTNYNFQATTNLHNWFNLGSSLADSNGLFQFLDTNATLSPYHRFYRWYYVP